MDYNEIAALCERLPYRDKFRLAQLLIQLGRKGEEESNPEGRTPAASNSEAIQYVGERLLKLKPAKRAAVLNSIGAMFQFQGGISEADKERIVTELQRQGWLRIDGSGRVSYP